LTDQWSTEQCETVTVQSKYAAYTQAPDGGLTGRIASAFNLTSVNSTYAAGVLSNLVQENWATGQVKLSGLWQLNTEKGFSPNFNSSGNVSIKRQCGVTTFCSFGVPKCQLVGWRSLAPTEGILHHNQLFFMNQAASNSARRLVHQEESELKKGRHLQQSSQLVSDDSARRLTFVPLLEQANRYTGPVIAPNKRTDVTVLWGLRPAASTPLVGAPAEQWSFDNAFEPANPWAQRVIYNACFDVPADLKIIHTDCWINQFRDWLRRQGRTTKDTRFPTRDFDDYVYQWYSSSSGKVSGSANLWMVEGKVKAAKIAFTTNIRMDSAAAEGVKYMEKWDNYIDRLNSAASVTANHAWYTAALFVRSEAEQAIIASTLETIIIAAACGWLGMLAFIKDPWTSTLVTSLVLGIISGLGFFMVVLMGWKIGPIEVISLVVFVGYSVTYSLHIAHNYVEVPSTDPILVKYELEYRRQEFRKQERLIAKEKARQARTPQDVEASPEGFNGVDYPEKATDAQDEPDEKTIMDPVKTPLTDTEIRRARTRMSVLHVGGATLSSAVSTLGSSMFLLFCTMNIFKQLGSVVIAVTFLSIVFALVPLPALLMVVGPEEEPACERYARCIRKTCCRGSDTHQDQYVNGDDEETILDHPTQPLVISGREVHHSPLARQCTG